MLPKQQEDGAMPLPFKSLGYAAFAGLLLLSPAAKADVDAWPAL